MALLEKIRVKMGLFITVIIGLALLSFIIDPGTLQSVTAMFSSKYDVGEMNGKGISYQDFQRKVEYYGHIHQLVTGSTSMDEETSEIINQSAWQDFISEEVMIPTIKSAGIEVGQEEMFDMSQGANISQILSREQIFMGEGGLFDRNRLVEFIRAIPSDPSGNLATYWEYLEKSMYIDQMVGKYVSLLSKSTIQNPIELKRAIDENNVTADLSFVMLPFGFDTDSTIAVTQQEVREYYNKNKHNFEQPASRDIEYVVFEVVPSPKDVEQTQIEIENLMPEFRVATNLRNFLARNSDKPLQPYYFKKGELASESAILDSFAFAAKRNDILEPYRQENLFRAARINDIKQLPDSVFVQHIMIQNPNIEAANATVDSLMNLLAKGADFSTLALENSVDVNSYAQNAGDLGWMTQNNLIPGFDTCFVVPVGLPFKLQSQYGNHIVRVSERTRPVTKVQLAVLEKGAIASRETFQEYYSKANEVASRADGKLENFNSVTAEMGLYPIPAFNIAQNAKNIGNYSNAREIVRWAFDAKKDEVSQIISLENKFFFIVAVTEIREEGIPSVEQLEQDIASYLRREKANEKMVASFKEQIAGLTSLEEIAEKLGTTVSTQSGVSFGAPGSRSFDPKFVGAVAGAELNSITGPVAGSIGVYIFTVDSRETGSFFTEDDAKQRREQSFALQMQRVPNIFEKNAGVKDYRAKFF